MLNTGAAMTDRSSPDSSGSSDPYLYDRYEVWQHLGSGERVTLSLHGAVTRLERSGEVSEFRNPSFDEAAVQIKIKLRMLRDMVQAQAGSAESAEEVAQQIKALGFPPELWAELDELETEFEFHYGDEEAKDAPGSRSLLSEPNPALLDRFRQIMAGRVIVIPPPDDAPFNRQKQALQKEGMIRLTARLADGSLALPPVLEPRRAALQATEQPVVRLAAHPGAPLTPWSSKVGGVPYRPRDSAWPQSREASPRPLVFLAQINLADANAGGKALPEFPAQGILQFFILNGGLYGANLDQPLAGEYRVIYWPDVVQDRAQIETTVPRPQADEAERERMFRQGLGVLPNNRALIYGQLPFDPAHETALIFLPDREPVSSADNGADEVLGTTWQTKQDDPSFHALYDFSPGGHKLGGYPNFIQDDRRAPSDNLILLMQLDSDDALGLMWGDMGTANFFIRPADLKARDFSRVVYNWDCG